MKQLAASKNFLELKLMQGCLKQSDIDSYIMYQGKVIEEYPSGRTSTIQYKLPYDAYLYLEKEEEYTDALLALDEARTGLLAGTEMDDFEEYDRIKKEKGRFIARFYIALAIVLLGLMVILSVMK